MILPWLDPAQVLAFLLILIRISAILVAAPIFGSDLVPTQLKIPMMIALAFFLFTLIPIDTTAFPQTITGFLPLVAGEVFLGLTMGLLVRTIFAGVQLAGQLVGYQMGMAIANVFDPQSGSQLSLLAEFSYTVAMFLFLVLNGHFLIIKGLVESFALVPPGRLVLSTAAMDLAVSVAGGMFVIAIKIGAAPFVVLFFTKVSMGIMAKVVPQMNVLFVGMPLYIMVGLFTFGLSLYFFPPILRSALTDVEASLLGLLRAL